MTEKKKLDPGARLRAYHAANPALERRDKRIAEERAERERRNPRRNPQAEGAGSGERTEDHR